VKNSVRTTHNS